MAQQSQHRSLAARRRLLEASRRRRSGGSRSPAPRRTVAVAAALLLALPGVVSAQEPSPELSPSVLASPAVAMGPGILGATREVARETFDDAAGWIDLGEDANGRTALEDGALFMSVKGKDVNYRDWLDLETPAAVLRVEALVDIDGRDATAGGVACGSGLGLPRWFIAGVNNADEWFFGRQIEGRFQLVDRGLLLAPISPSKDAVTVVIECASAPDEGGDYVAISVDGRPVSIATGLGRLDIPVGPYGRAGLYVATDAGTGSAVFDDMIVHVGDVYAPAPVDRSPGKPSE